MSYARFGAGGSDVYVYMDIGGYLDCCGCQLEGDFAAHSTAAMIAHLHEHAAAGHHVPSSVIPRLEADDAENFPPARDAAGAALAAQLEESHG